MALISKSPTPEELWQVFPEICFPDLSAPALTVSDEMISVYDPDSQWVVQSDIVIAQGGGTMTFFCKAPPEITAAGPDGTTRQWSLPEAVKDLLPQIGEFYLVERGESVWTFRGATDENVKIIITAEVYKISWKYE